MPLGQRRPRLELVLDLALCLCVAIRVDAGMEVQMVNGMGSKVMLPKLKYEMMALV